MGITSVTPEDVLVVARAGSHMYGLATPTSDTDYIIVFREPTEVSLSVNVHVHFIKATFTVINILSLSEYHLIIQVS